MKPSSAAGGIDGRIEVEGDFAAGANHHEIIIFDEVRELDGDVFVGIGQNQAGIHVSVETDA